MADLVGRSAATGTLIGICPTCDRFMYRAVSLGAVERACGNLAVARQMPQQRLDDMSAAFPNVGFKQGKES